MWLGGPRAVHAGAMASFAGGLAWREPGRCSPWRMTRWLGGFIRRPVGGVVWAFLGTHWLSFRPV